jgi:hypothetical protein
VRKQVSEKTLEINISAELLAIIRQWPGCENSYWLGMKQWEEADSGLDELLENGPAGSYLGIQFKAPWASRPDTNPYRYTLNELQQENLLNLARGGRSVYYLFPNFNTVSRLIRAAPQLLEHTYVVSPERIGHLGDRPRRRHRVECYEPTGQIDVRSPVHISSNPTANEFFRQAGLPTSVSRLLRGLKLLTQEEMKSWLLNTIRIGYETRRVGQLLRGFSAVGLR